MSFSIARGKEGRDVFGVPVQHGVPCLSLLPLVDFFPYKGNDMFRTGKGEFQHDWRFHLSKNTDGIVDGDWLLFWVTPDDDLQLFMKLWTGVSPTAGKFLYGACGKARLLVFHNPGNSKTPLSAYVSARMVPEWQLGEKFDVDE